MMNNKEAVSGQNYNPRLFRANPPTSCNSADQEIQVIDTTRTPLPNSITLALLQNSRDEKSQALAQEISRCLEKEPDHALAHQLLNALDSVNLDLEHPKVISLYLEFLHNDSDNNEVMRYSPTF